MRFSGARLLVVGQGRGVDQRQLELGLDRKVDIAVEMSASDSAYDAVRLDHAQDFGFDARKRRSGTKAPRLEIWFNNDVTNVIGL